jgi:hypothetical protein
VKFSPSISVAVLFLFGTLLVLMGCGGARVISREGAPTATHRLTSAKVVWLDNPSLQYKVSQLFQYRYGPPESKPEISEKDKYDTQQVVGRLLTVFHESAAQALATRLIQEGIPSGEETVIEISPVTANAYVGGGRSITLRVTIKEPKSDKGISSITISANGPKEDADQVLVANLITGCVAELKSTGWIAH